MNFFKNAIVYRMTRDIQISSDELEAQLKNLEFSPCGSQDMMKVGWTNPIKTGEALTHSVGNQILIVAKREEKKLPTDVIKKELQAKIDKLETEQGRRLKKTEKDSLKDEVVQDLLPRAFSKESTVSVWIDNDNQRIIVDASSAKRAEDTLALLRKTLGSLPVVPLTMKTPIELTLTDWLRDGVIPQGFNLTDEAELKAMLAEGGIARFKKQDLVSDEIASHIEAGKLVTKLSLDWNDTIQFTLCDDCSLKKIKFSDMLKAQNDDIDREDIAQRFDADFVLLTSEMTRLIDAVIQSLGGEVD
ncbi:Recombination-associated protein RdgC [Providencia alcalifaciens]|uniref:Recombination-associated protein RdgC n=1 Tax=Providencia alcalifaciens DSM 30120 TaxID=520999 RepID=B6XBD2_9GAMM|nr:recombination-associated protein RdgC [Providencia alcalifaciens]EEB47289.1 recombination associated protein [Providencia alcalifaciens DSM 30120]WGZ53145.1 recombination-associated protein RdgC [Providencia alcalifaciens]CAG9414954.1 Recombination-associated protein RdgC [Providencia alcalifaciens]CAG9429066.1 Recombination-associated protein RdgC [Providencia alcalifaciens]SQI33167.1 Recombination-associated protein rdgC [Providencia alcalifaciens]